MHLSDPVSGLGWIFPLFLKDMAFRYWDLLQMVLADSFLFVLHVSSFQNDIIQLVHS